MVRAGPAMALALLAVACGVGIVRGVGNEVVSAGDTVNVAGWDVRTVDTRIDRVENIESGKQPFDIQVSAWFSGNGKTTFESDLTIAARTGSGVMYRPVLGDCPDGLDVGRPVNPDQAIEGFVCFDVAPADTTELHLMLTAVKEADEPILLEVVDPVAEGTDNFGPDEAVAELREQGVQTRLVPSPYARSPFLTRAKTEQVLCLDGEEAILYEYATEELRTADSDLILPSGGFENGHFDLLYGRVMWWAKGRVIVNYNLGNPEYWEVFTAVFEETLSPDGETYQATPDPQPPSEPCI